MVKKMPSNKELLKVIGEYKKQVAVLLAENEELHQLIASLNQSVNRTVISNFEIPKGIFFCSPQDESKLKKALYEMQKEP